MVHFAQLWASNLYCSYYFLAITNEGFPTLFKWKPGIMRVKVHEQVDTLIKLDWQKVNQEEVRDIVYSQLEFDIKSGN
jgi:hypothetical protein